MIKITRLAVVLAVLACAACKGPTDPSKNTVDSFSGTVQPGSTDLKEFTVSNTGEITVKVLALSPNNAIVGIGYGQSVSATNCALIQNNLISNANVGRTVLSGSILVKGPYCLAVFDPSAASPTFPATYTVEISHP